MLHEWTWWRPLLAAVRCVCWGSWAGPTGRLRCRAWQNARAPDYPSQSHGPRNCGSPETKVTHKNNRHSWIWNPDVLSTHECDQQDITILWYEPTRPGMSTTGVIMVVLLVSFSGMRLCRHYSTILRLDHQINSVCTSNIWSENLSETVMSLRVSDLLRRCRSFWTPGSWGVQPSHLVPCGQTAVKLSFSSQRERESGKHSLEDYWFQT